MNNELDTMVEVSLHMFNETNDYKHLEDAMYWNGEIDTYYDLSMDDYFDSLYND